MDLLLILPHGVWKKSHTMEGLVETSTNLASVKAEEGAAGHTAFTITTSTRSSLTPALEQVGACLNCRHARTRLRQGYVGAAAADAPPPKKALLWSRCAARSTAWAGSVAHACSRTRPTLVSS